MQMVYVALALLAEDFKLSDWLLVAFTLVLVQAIPNTFRIRNARGFLSNVGAAIIAVQTASVRFSRPSIGRSYRLRLLFATGGVDQHGVPA
jgi:hypothetical protein